MPKTLRKTLWFDDDLIRRLEEVRARERPIPSFTEFAIRLIWRGLSGYQVSRIDFEKVPLLESPRISYCDACGSLLPKLEPLERASFCDRCGVKIPITVHKS